MKVKQLLEFITEETKKDKNFLEKEITFYDFQNNVAHRTPDIVTCVDLSDDKYFDIVYNYCNM